MATQHSYGEGYSAHNQVPTVQKYKSEVIERNKQIDADQAAVKANQNATPSKGSEEKAALMNNMQNHDNPAKKLNAKGERTVHDPVTGADVVIRDAQFNKDTGAKQWGPDNLDPRYSDEGPALNPIAGSEKIQANQTAPAPAEPSNICLQDFPPPVDTKPLNSIKKSLYSFATAISVAMAIIWFMVAFRAGWYRFFLRSALCGSVAIGSWISLGVLERNIAKDIERTRLYRHVQRAEQFSPPMPESVEWLNSIILTVWKLVNPDMFAGPIDMIEDVMQASLPKFISAVRIADVGQGSNPFRIISMRALPDQPGDKEYPRDSWIDQGQPQDAQIKQAEEKASKALDPNKASQEELDVSQSGDYVNYEVSFMYASRPGTKANDRINNMHLMLEFFIGVFDWVNIPVPIWAQVEEIVGTIRLRIQMVEAPPFVRNVTFTMMGVPAVEVSVQPMIKALPNILDLPIISGFVKTAIAAACNEYVAPKSMTMNVAQMLAGDGIKKDTKALGVLVIKIHSAEGLSAQDTGGGSDPYLVLAYAKFGKPLYSTRIIVNDLNPVWEETAFLLVSDDEVRSKEALSAQLWDSDKTSADDLVGRVHVDLSELMAEPNVMKDRTDKLSGFEDAEEMPGKLHWSIGYFDKVKLNQDLKQEAGTNKALPKQLENKPELQQEGTAVDTQEEKDALKIPPDPKYPSGILSVIVHQINNLERQDLKGAMGGDREGKAGQDTDAPSEQDHNLPNSYCEFVLNDELIYKTRVKQMTSMPFFEAGTEAFIRDWENTSLRIVVRDSRVREHDPVLGVVSLDLTDVFETSSAVTRLYSITEGVGFGRVNVSLLFKAVDTKLPRELLGWETSTIEVISDIKAEMDDPDMAKHFSGKKLLLQTSEGEEKISSKDASHEGSSVVWKVDPQIRMPIYQRYASSLVFEIGPASFLPGSSTDAIAVLWLNTLLDDEEQDVKIPILVGKKLSQLRQNAITDATANTHEYKQVGFITAKIRLDSGLDPDHEDYAKTQTAKHVFDAYERVEGRAKTAEQNSHAADDGVIDSDEKKAIKDAKRKQLHARHRGLMQFQSARTAVWAADGAKKRGGVFKKLFGRSPREPTVQTEA